MPHGTIKFFNAAKKFGFVTPDDGGKDVFVPVASVVAAGISTLTAGQRVSFDTEPDTKGPKAVNLALSDTPAPRSAVKEPTPVFREQRKPHFTFYHDASCDRSQAVLAELRDAGVDLHEVDYVATPPGREELKRLSMLLQDGSGSMVRRFDPLFHDLRLDDRFISQNEFWDGIVENPSLINGPVLANAKSAFIFSSDNALKQFLTANFPGHVPGRAEKKAAAAPVAPPVTEVEPVTTDDAESDLEAIPDAPKAKAAKKPKTEPAAEKKAKAAPVAKKAVKKAASAKKK